MPDESPRLLKLVDVAKHIGVPIRTLYVWLDDGRFPVPPVAGTKPRRWNAAHIDAWMQNDAV